MKRYLLHSLFVCLFVCVGGLINHVFAGTKYICSSSDFANVTSDDDVIVNCYRADITLSKNITCKSLTFAAQETRLNCSTYKLSVTGDLTINDIYKCATITNANLEIGGDLSIRGQESTITGSLVKVDGNIVISKYKSGINADVQCHGNLTMDQQETYITGTTTVDGDIFISGYSAGVGGTVYCGGNLTMTSQNAYITGDVEVVGNLTMNGYEAKITGSASVGGESNISNRANVSGGITEISSGVTNIDVSISGSPCEGVLTASTEETGVSYQWHKDGTAISGATSSTYNPALTGEGDYFCVVTKTGALGTSNSITYYGGPKIESISTNSLNFINSVDGATTSKEVVITTICDESNTEVTPSIIGDDATKFSVVKDGTTYRVTFLETSDIGSYSAVLNLTTSKSVESVNLSGIVTAYHSCYSVDRYVSGIYYDSYCLHPDDDGNITINLNNGDNDLVYIPQSSFCDTCAAGRQQKESGTWADYYKHVTIRPTENISCNNFTFVGTVKGGQDFDIKFVNNVDITCTAMDVTTTQSKNYFLTDCDSKITASTSVSLRHSYKPIEVRGTILAPTIYISDGNNTSIEIAECAYVKAENLTLAQSNQNNILIEGHIVADNIEAEANLKLIYDGTKDNDAIVTVGQLTNSNITIICGENTVVNLCKNPNLNHADIMGYYNGAVLYNTNASDGWSGGSTPSMEGDINYNDNSSAYWTYYNDSDGLYNTWHFAKLNEIGGYSSYENCMSELNMASLLGMDDDPFIPKDKEIKILYDDFNPCSEEYESSKVQIREMGGKWFRVINGELIYCENDN